MSLFRKKSIDALLAHANNSRHGLQRTLGPGSLVALGIGAIIGAGLFVRTADAAGHVAGPAVMLSFVIAAVGCLFAGLCYAEFAAMIPISGSAYAYSFVTMGELVAWIIGWALVLEYALGAATVSIAWSEYLNKLFDGAIPFAWCHSPWDPAGPNGEHGLCNVPALLILAILTGILIKGTKESALVNAIIVFVKVAIVLLFIVVGWQFVSVDNHTPFFIAADDPTTEQIRAKALGQPLPEGHRGFLEYGWGGVLRGASIVFFAFIGFDAVSTAAQEAKKPERDMPIGILGSLVACTILYVLFGHVLTGVANWQEFVTSGKEASVAFAIQAHMPGYGWLATSVTVAILAGFSSVILVMLLGQSRVFFSMAHDGLLPRVFSDLHPRFRTPYKANLLLFVLVGAFGGFVPGSVAGDLTSFGTLLAFVLVSAGILVMRRSNPGMARPFRTPFVPLVPVLGVLVCGGMLVAIDPETQLVALGWMAFGLLIYFAYSRHHSHLKHS
ncbi:MAG: amino acid permease [Planctomycetes bacterium]|nr:amino acid permease [Planctomycetota bacterium]